MKDSISHFWLMIWQQKCPGVVMLNKLVEEGKVSEKQARNVPVFRVNISSLHVCMSGFLAFSIGLEVELIPGCTWLHRH